MRVRVWLLVVGIVTGLCGITYLAIQQQVRLSANDLSMQLAEDTAFQLEHGKDPRAFTSPFMVDLATSLSPYVIVYDDKLTMLGSMAILNGKTPTPPSGVFAYAKSHSLDKFTWQPQKGVRSAVVVIPYTTGAVSGYVLAGHSLREVEKRIDLLTWQMMAGWSAIVLASGMYIKTAFPKNTVTKKHTA